MIAALPGTNAVNQLTADIQAAAPGVIFFALCVAALVYFVSRKWFKIILGGCLIGTIVFSGLGLAWLQYVMSLGRAG